MTRRLLRSLPQPLCKWCRIRTSPGSSCGRSHCQALLTSHIWRDVQGMGAIYHRYDSISDYFFIHSINSKLIRIIRCFKRPLPPYIRLKYDMPEAPISPIPRIPITETTPGSMIPKNRSAADVIAIQSPADGFGVVRALVADWRTTMRLDLMNAWSAGRLSESHPIRSHIKRTPWGRIGSDRGWTFTCGSLPAVIRWR